MFRYVALAWDRRDHEARRSALNMERLIAGPVPAWMVLPVGPNVRFLHRDFASGGVRAHVASSGSAVVFGTVFRRGQDACSADPSDALRTILDEAVSSHGMPLIERVWGRYMAILRDPDSDALWVLRDPSGGMPCFAAEINGVSLFFSHVEDCIRVLPASHRAINWRYVFAFVRHPRLYIAETGLAGVMEILPGELYEWSRTGVARSFAWQPTEHASGKPVNDFSSARNAVRAAVTDCVGSWARGYERIALQVSGGLDSRVVLVCVRKTRVAEEVSCINYHAANVPESDERGFARLAASAAGCALSEIVLRPEAVRYERVLSCPLSAKPGLSILSWADDVLDQVARTIEATALFSGEG